MQWTDADRATITRLYPDYAAIGALIPGRTERQLMKMAYRMGLTKGQPINKSTRKRANPLHYRPEEIEALIAGARSLPGRTAASVRRARREYVPAELRHVRTKWTPKLLEQCATNPAMIPVGQTRDSVRNILRRKGIRYKLKIVRGGKPKPVAAPSGSVLACAAPTVPGYDLMAQVSRLWSGKVTTDFDLDVMSEIILGIFEGRYDQADLPAARRAAVTKVRREQESFGGKFVSIDAPFANTDISVIDDLAFQAWLPLAA